MTILQLGGTDTENKEQGRAAFFDALVNSAKAIKEHPALNGNTHNANINDVKSEVIGFTKFKIKTTANSSNYYETHRVKLPIVNGPGTALKFDFKGQKNFTPKDAKDLDGHLTKIFPNLKLNVCFKPGKPICVIHVPL